MVNGKAGDLEGCIDGLVNNGDFWSVLLMLTRDITG
jgi:hypothetical protein